MLKWLITLGLLSFVAWRWWSHYRVFLNRIRKNKAPSAAHDKAALGAQPSAKAAPKTMVRRCHHCGTMMPPDLGIQQGPFFFCKEHVPSATPEP